MATTKELLEAIHGIDCQILQRIALRIDLVKDLSMVKRISFRDFWNPDKENHVVRNHRVLMRSIADFAEEAGISKSSSEKFARPEYVKGADADKIKLRIFEADQETYPLLERRQALINQLMTENGCMICSEADFEEQTEEIMNHLKNDMVKSRGLAADSGEFKEYYATALENLKQQRKERVLLIDSEKEIEICYNMLQKETSLFQEEGDFCTVSWREGGFEAYYREIL